MQNRCPPRLTRGLEPDGRRVVEKAYRYAWESLSDIKRRTGVSYAEHGTDVALVLREISASPSLIAVALLHDIFLLPNGDSLLSQSMLSPAERTLAKTMHELRRLHIDANTNDLDRVIEAFSSDERLLVLRMAHRLNDVRHLSRFTPALQLAIARETLHMYTSIAGRLGMHAWRFEMEETCFRFLQPEIAKELEDKMLASRPLDLVCIRHAQRFLNKKMKLQRIPCTIGYRIKGLYSTYRKMALKNRTFEELTDRIALRLIVPTVQDCYRTLGVIHGVFHPIPGKLKDYIGAPKENGYRSIHTVVFPLRGVTEQPMEIQIRTAEMHEECELGIARHADYKHTLYALQSAPTRVQLFRNLLTLRQETRSPKQFATAMRRYFDDGHVAIFDAENNLYHLPKPATAQEFVALVHGSETVVSVKINGRKQPLNMPLRDGDTVEATVVASHARTRRKPVSRSPSRAKPDPRK